MFSELFDTAVSHSVSFLSKAWASVLTDATQCFSCFPNVKDGIISDETDYTSGPISRLIKSEAVNIGNESENSVCSAISNHRISNSNQDIEVLISKSENSACSTEPESTTQKSCCYCGSSYHNRTVCPAKNVNCNFCAKRGHFDIVCRKRARIKTPCLPTLDKHYPSMLKPAIVNIEIDGHSIRALIDTGSSDSFIDKSIAEKLQFSIQQCNRTISLASSYSTVQTLGVVTVSKLNLQEFSYENFSFQVLNGLCCDAIIGHDLFRFHRNVIVNFGGEGKDITIGTDMLSYDNDVDNLGYSFKSTCCVAQADIEPAPLFYNISSDCKPIACKSRRYSSEDQKFIHEQVHILKREGVVEPSHSPWRAQVLVHRDNGAHKPRMVVDYSRTINKYTSLDAYPLPRIDDMALEVSKLKYYSTFDLKSAYHQIPILEADRIFTAFEADGELLQFTRIPFGVTNGVAAFQRTIDSIIK